MTLEKIIQNFPSQFLEGYKLAGETGKKYSKQKFDNIVICGMGGSGLAGELLNFSAKELGIKIPILIHKNYDLPVYAAKKSLLIIVSYSGNTEETTSSYKDGVKRKLSTIVISSGGMLKNLTKKNKIPFVQMPEGVPPRFTLGWQFGALLKILVNSKLIAHQTKDLAVLNSLRKNYEQDAKKLAKKLKNTTPLIYSSDKNKALAYIFKIQLNETAKKQAFYNVFPELNHNEIMGFKEKNKNFSVILLKDSTDHERIQKRMRITENIIKKQGYSIYTIDITNKNLYNGILYAVMTAMWLSYYIAKEKHIDPSSTDLVDTLKKSL